MSIEAMKLPQGITRDDTEHGVIYYTEAQLRQAIEQAQKPEGYQEPVAWLNPIDGEIYKATDHGQIKWLQGLIPLYTSLPQRQPLTDEEAHNVGERAEELIGYGYGAWDTRPLHEIVHAVLTAVDEMRGIKGEA